MSNLTRLRQPASDAGRRPRWARLDAAMLLVKPRLVDAPRAEVSVLARGGKRKREAATMAPYTVFIRDMRVETLVGAFDHERIRPTALMMDIDIEMAGLAGSSDALRDTIDYGEVVTDVRRCLATKRYYPLERLSEFVAARILEKFGAFHVRVSVAKVGIIEGVGRVGVTVERPACGVVSGRTLVAPLADVKSGSVGAPKA
jgi:7,8-dihydroneopterin aldolase/epimerase/oxygenase